MPGATARKADAANACRAFTELRERGFIELVTKGAFSRKSPHASEWRLTFNTAMYPANSQPRRSCAGAAKNKHVPSRYQIRATVPHEITRKEPLGAFDWYREGSLPGSRGINLGHT